MTSKTVSRNQVQTPDVNTTGNGTHNTLGTTAVIIYTCPVDKVAIVKSLKTRSGSFGANTILRVNAKGTRLRETATANEPDMIESGGNGIRLDAGETLSLSGDSASNNGVMTFDFNLQELPA